MNRRTLLAATASAAASVAAAGCLTDDDPGASTTERTTSERSTTGGDETATTSDPSETTEDGSSPWSEAANEPDPSKEVRLGNEGEDGVAHTVDLEVYHASTGEVVHDQSHEIPADSELIAYDTADANPTGVEAFRVTAEFDGDSKQVRIETSKCYGWAEFVISAEDEFRASYAIC